MASVCDFIEDSKTKDALTKAKDHAMQNVAMVELIESLLPYVDCGDVAGFHSVWDKQADWAMEQMGEYAPLFYLVVADFQIEKSVWRHLEWGIPAQITRDTFSDLDVWTKRHRKAHGGACGLSLDGLDWLHLHLSGKLFRIGRLQYRAWDYPEHSVVLQDLQTGQFVPVAAGGVRLNRDGKLSNDTDGGFVTVFEADGQRMLAHGIDSETGQVHRDPSEFSCSRYQCVLRPGDRVIDAHIPEDGKLPCDEVLRSMEQALSFFQTFFPDDYKAYYLYSWLLSNEIREILPPESNIRKFTGLFTRTISGTGTHEYVYPWIFGFDKNREDFRREDAKTALQKGAKMLLEEGRWFTECSGFLMLKTP